MDKVICLHHHTTVAITKSVDNLKNVEHFVYSSEISGIIYLMMLFWMNLMIRLRKPKTMKTMSQRIVITMKVSLMEVLTMEVNQDYKLI